jgi:hypothetical protein
MKIYAISNKDGSIEIMRILMTYYYTGEEITIESEIARFSQEKQDQIVSYKEINEEDLPSDRIFRNAWTISDKKIDYDLNKAKELKKEELRILRQPLLQDLDVQYMKALEQSLPTKDIVDQKQILRDITAVEMPDDIEQLKTFIPEVLQQNDNSK